MLRTLVKGQRAFQMYLPNNPIYHRAIDNVRAAFAPLWTATAEITLSVAETDFVWEENVVYQQANKTESLAWTLYKDGLRTLTFREGVEDEEIVSFLQTINRVRQLPPDAGDDLLTLLWEHDFHYIQYRFADLGADAAVPGLDSAGLGVSAPPPAELQERVREDAKAEEGAPAEEPPRPKGVVDIEEYESTLYFLDEGEVAKIKRDLEWEYSRDLRGSALNSLFDIFELQTNPEIRAEALAILDFVFPNLLNVGDFKAAAETLRQTRILAKRARQLTPEILGQLRGFDQRLSDPAIVNQVMQALDEGSTTPTDEDIRELLSELLPTALEPLIVWLPRISAATIRVCVTEAVERLAMAHPQEVLALLRRPEAEAHRGVVELCGRLKLEEAVPGLSDALDHPDAARRLAVVEALIAIDSPAILPALDRGVEDGDRAVRMASVRAMAGRRYRGALRRIEPVIFGKRGKDMDFNEKRAFFEAYGSIAGEAALKPLAGMLLPTSFLFFQRRRSAEVRMCAALGIGKIGTAEARDLLQRVANDKDRQVRNAVGAALRGSVA